MKEENCLVVKYCRKVVECLKELQKTGPTGKCNTCEWRELCNYLSALISVGI